MIPSVDSAGGIITILDSIKHLGKWLPDRPGASAESQRLIRNLHALQLILHCLDNLESTSLNESYVKAVQAEADSSMKLLSELLLSTGKCHKPESMETIAANSKSAQCSIASMDELSRLQSEINIKIEEMNLSATTGVERLMYVLTFPLLVVPAKTRGPGTRHLESTHL